MVLEVDSPVQSLTPPVSWLDQASLFSFENEDSNSTCCAGILGGGVNKIVHLKSLV